MYIGGFSKYASILYNIEYFLKISPGRLESLSKISAICSKIMTSSFRAEGRMKFIVEKEKYKGSAEYSILFLIILFEISLRDKSGSPGIFFDVVRGLKYW